MKSSGWKTGRSILFLAAAVVMTGACDVSEGSSDADRAAIEVDEGTLVEEKFDSSAIADFAGSWEAVSDDGTNGESAEFEVTESGATGILRTLERGYYSGKVKVTAEVAVRGALRSGGLDLQILNNETGGIEPGVTGRAMRRGDYLIVHVGDGESSYARPGVSLVQSAEGSPPATSLLNAVAGRVFSSTTQASGRGAFVGNRVRLALCSDGSIAFDVSDLATTGGADAVDMGSAASRRGTWTVVLRAGLPVVRAQWNGTGSSYSLTRYFRVQPNANGSSALVDGTELGASGSC